MDFILSSDAVTPDMFIGGDFLFDLIRKSFNRVKFCGLGKLGSSV